MYLNDKQVKAAEHISYVKIVRDQHTDITRHATPGERWDADSTDTQTVVRGLELTEKDAYCDLIVPFKVLPAQTYFLVYVEYGDGDSFSSHGGCVDWIDLFQSFEKADALAKAIKEDTTKPRGFEVDKKDGKVPNTIEYEWDNGQKALCYTYTWKGYFASFEHVSVIPVTIGFVRY